MRNNNVSDNNRKIEQSAFKCIRSVSYKNVFQSYFRVHAAATKL